MDNNRMGEIILVESPNDANTIQWEKGSENLDPKVQVMSDAELPVKLENYKLDGKSIDRIYKNDVLIRHPFKPDTYVYGPVSEEKILSDKLTIISEIFKDLGAKKVKYDYEIKKTEKFELQTDGNVGIKGLGISGLFSSNTNQKFAFIEKMEENYDGGNPDLKTAIQRAEKFGLYDDVKIRHFIEQRDGIHMQVGEQHYEMSISKEMDDLKKATMSINYLKTFKLDASFQEQMETKYDLNLKITVVYPPKQSDQK